ncbi:uncharacterized protein LOC124350686 [Daphnia pulicaria]|uniref:uncharacterized protein LOC124350686 n=1 Tax=Daphnia pulicaria TaxID=35523 RepID=UPI001EEB3244|nr:uncharacterized protein LOC124350686 [Daphnia pulicaria]
MVLDYWYYPPNPPTRGDFGQSAFRHEIEQSRNYFSPASYKSSWQFWVSNMSKITKEFLLKRMKKKMKPSPSHWTGTDHLNAALEEAGCKTPDEMMIAFHRAMTGSSEPISRLPESLTRSLYPVDGEQKVDDDDDDDDDDDFGFRKFLNPKVVRGNWKMPRLHPIFSTANLFLVVLITRSPNGRNIPSDYFDKLRNSFLENGPAIRKFLYDLSGLQYEIHLIQECAADEPISILESDTASDDSSADDFVDFPASHVEHLFMYHFVGNAKVGYMVNCPLDLNGSMSNYAANLRNLEMGGIKPADVIYMSHGLEMDAASNDSFYDVVPNFTIFSGDKMMEKLKELNSPESSGIPDSHNSAVDGFLSAAGYRAKNSPDSN